MDELTKTYVGSVSGAVVDLSQQLSALQSSFTPAVASGMPATPGRLQPGETTGGAGGEMVVDSPSDSGTGLVVPGAGERS